MKPWVTATILSLLLTFSLLGLITDSRPASATPTTINVPTPDYPTIQEAINKAKPGDTISVASGTYKENVVINQSVTLIGNGYSVTTIEALDTRKVVIDVRISNVNISGFTIQSGIRGVSIFGYNAINISDCRIISNYYEGIYFLSSRNSTVNSNKISSNGFEGVYLQFSNKTTISNNIISGNTDGVGLVSSNNTKISNNTITFHSLPGTSGIYLDYYDTPYTSLNNTVDGNTISNNNLGVSTSLSNNNRFHHNNFINNTHQVDPGDAVNSWNTTAEGNYWSDYHGQDVDGNGIGDTPYIIDETNQDNFPLMHPLIPPIDVAPPITSDDYDGLWHTEDFSINLKAFDLDKGVKETYYKINGGEEKSVSANGQPFITLERADNTLEYWSVDNVDNVETHHLLTNIKLDKTPPSSGSIVINNGDAYATSISVTLNLSAADSTSGVAQMRFSNDNVTWASLEPYATSKAWNITSPEGVKTVYVIYVDNAGLNSQAYHDTIVLDTAPPTISILYPDMGAQIRSQSVTITWNGTDAGSGIDHYELALDNGSFTINVTEQTYTISSLNDGNHTVIVKASDKIGRSSVASVTFVVNTSPLGGPGYLEEAALIVIVIVAIGMIVYFLRLRKKRPLERALNLSAKT